MKHVRQCPADLFTLIQFNQRPICELMQPISCFLTSFAHGTRKKAVCTQNVVLFSHKAESSRREMME